MGHSFAFALTAQLVAGLVFLLIAVTPLKEYLFNAIPHTIKLAVTAGIGLFIALIGLSSAGLVVSNPATLISIGEHNIFAVGNNRRIGKFRRLCFQIKQLLPARTLICGFEQT